MIVDDDPSVVKTLERIFYKKNYLFYSVFSGEDALKEVEEIEADMILLDIFMKGISGYEVCQGLRQKGIIPRIPVIFLTSNNHTEDIVKGFQAGAVDYIVKPFNAEELLARVETHLELKRAREDLKTANRVKTRFFSIMTHDIKDAIVGVKGVTEFLHQELDTTKVNTQEALKLTRLLLNDSTQLFKLLDKLIEWNIIETGRKYFFIQPIHLNQFFKKTIEDHHVLWSEKKLHVKLNGKQEILASTDLEALRSIVGEVLSNAIKYSHQNGHIQIDLQKEGNYNIITIKDEGVGMDKEVTENVFQLDTPHPKTIGTFQEQGIGLGLIICKALIDKLKGQIHIASEKHKGSAVTIKLPDLE